MDRDVMERLNTARVYLLEVVSVEGTLPNGWLMFERLCVLLEDAEKEIASLRREKQRMEDALDFVADPVLPGETVVPPLVKEKIDLPAVFSEKPKRRRKK